MRGRTRPSSLESELLLQINLHILKIKGHRVRFEEIVADRARELEAESALPRERSIVETQDVVFLYISKG